MKRFSFLALMFFALTAQADIARFSEVDPGRFYRGGQPETTADYERLKALGIETIVNLRYTDDIEAVKAEKQIIEGLGMTQVYVPMITAWMPKFPFIRSLTPAPKLEVVVAAIRAVADPANHKLFLHCQFGKDRTGLVSGYYRVLFQGWSKDAAYQEMRTIGFTPLEFGLQKFWSKTSTDACSPLVRGVLGEQNCPSTPANSNDSDDDAFLGMDPLSSPAGLSAAFSN